MSWVYKGPGFFPDVPARDLTDEEMIGAAERHPGIEESGVYQHATAEPERPAEPEPADETPRRTRKE
jgi:hypothetical protein